MKSSADLRGPLGRLRVVRMILLMTWIVLGVRAAHLTVLDSRGAERGAAQHTTTLRLSPNRGLVVDRNGAELAVSVDAPSVYATPSGVQDVAATARALAAPLGLDSAALARRLSHDAPFVFLARWIEADAARQIRDLALAGIGIVAEPRRVYPYNELAASVVGFANIDGHGVRGIEQQEDDWLRGTAHAYPVERDARGRLLALPGVRPTATAGGDVALTLDAAFQADAEAALSAAVAGSGAKGGLVLTLDAHSGEILALAERPNFDPNRFRDAEYAETRSRAFHDALEPGSTLKIFLLAGALDIGSVREDEVFDCENGSFRVPGKTLRDHHPYGLLTAADVLRVSSNIGAVKIAYRMGAQSYFETLRRFGFGQPTGSGFPSESSGVLRNWTQWKRVDHATIAFGQGIAVTPIQLAAAVAAIANDGVWIRPRLVAARRRPGDEWRFTERERVRRVLEPESAASVLAMMEGVVMTNGGTGGRARLRGVRVAGKTGTAQILDASTGAYSTNRYHSWFVGIVPADDPKLVIATELDEPKAGFHTGGAAAAPLFARVAAAQLTRIGIVTEPEASSPALRAMPVPSQVEGSAFDDEKG